MKKTAPALLISLLLAGPLRAASPGTLFQTRTLPNGLTVVVQEDRSIPVAAVNVWYNVGSKDEKKGKTGFAHLFEHYMFEGSEHAPGGQYFSRIFGMGGITNANTTSDRTDYYAVVPSEGVEEVLRLESDRMGWLRGAMNQGSLDKQRGIVKNEKRLREGQPYGGAWEALGETVWPKDHPYRWPVIGSMADLDGASLDDVKAFHAEYYAPNNAVLTVAGDVSAAEVFAQAEKWFGAIPAGKAPSRNNIPAVTAPAQASRTVVDDKARLPLLFVAYPIPGKGQPGWAEMAVVASVLGGGRTSRLVQALQYDRNLVLSVDASVTGMHENDLFIVSAMPAPGVKADVVRAAIDAELAKVVRDGVTPRELGRVRAGLKTARLDALQEAEGVAASLAEGQGRFGDPGFNETVDARVQAMDPEAARAAAAKYLRPGNAAGVSVVPAPRPGGPR
ncbi:insulinase family protein [bacterium]|nr:MAG: insulinase family protein [bacterium]